MKLRDFGVELRGTPLDPEIFFFEISAYFDYIFSKNIINIIACG